MIILIPAYEPDTKLVDLLAAIREEVPSQQVVVIDDGSGPAYQPIFDKAFALGCAVLYHRRNLGKGAALKTGFAYIAHRWPGDDVVCADCDGQHRLGDIHRVAAALEAGRAPIVLGARAFDAQVPLRSRFGNAATWLRRIVPATIMAEQQLLSMARLQQRDNPLDEIVVIEVVAADGVKL